VISIFIMMLRGGGSVDEGFVPVVLQDVHEFHFAVVVENRIWFDFEHVAFADFYGFSVNRECAFAGDYEIHHGCAVLDCSVRAAAYYVPDFDAAVLKDIVPRGDLCVVSEWLFVVFYEHSSTPLQGLFVCRGRLGLTQRSRGLR